MTKEELIDILALANAAIKKAEIQKEDALLQYAKDNCEYQIGDKVRLTSFNTQSSINLIHSVDADEEDYKIRYWVEKLKPNGKRTGEVRGVGSRTIELIEKSKPTNQ